MSLSGYAAGLEGHTAATAAIRRDPDVVEEARSLAGRLRGLCAGPVGKGGARKAVLPWRLGGAASCRRAADGRRGVRGWVGGGGI